MSPTALFLLPVDNTNKTHRTLKRVFPTFYEARCAIAKSVEKTTLKRTFNPSKRLLGGA
ncbi:hypothetical protein [Caballeronia fortuita]|uniref:hypothetical protein n=1 Tax=Caballeronia fortuita TaxID=1777138 RepID=UPI000AD7994A|nr:hypothetical protein [Caballeronia fortuita]